MFLPIWGPFHTVFRRITITEKVQNGYGTVIEKTSEEGSMTETISISPADDLQLVFDTAPENAVIRLAPGEYRRKTVIRRPG